MSLDLVTKRLPDGAVLIWQGCSIPDNGGFAGVESGEVPKFVGFGLLVLAMGHVLAALRVGRPTWVPPQLSPVLRIIAGLVLQLLLQRSTRVCRSLWAAVCIYRRRGWQAQHGAEPAH